MLRHAKTSAVEGKECSAIALVSGMWVEKCMAFKQLTLTCLKVKFAVVWYFLWADW